MAQIRDIRLDMGQLQDQQAFADVQFTVEFSESELRRNMQYGLYAGLFFSDERSINAELDNNGAYQTYLMPMNPPMGAFSGLGNTGLGANWGLNHGNPNPEFGAYFGGQPGGYNSHYPNGSMNEPSRDTGFVCWIARENLQPAGTRTHHVERRVTFDFTRMPQRDANYRALVWALPEITEGYATSQPMRANGNMMQSFQTQRMS